MCTILGGGGGGLHKFQWTKPRGPKMLDCDHDISGNSKTPFSHVLPVSRLMFRLEMGR